MNRALERTYLPAAGRDLLLPLYDPLTNLLGIGKLHDELIERARLEDGQSVLEVGCGTGNLLIALKRRHSGVEAVGLDPDPRALARAADKARRAGVALTLDQGFADTLPYDAGRFDRVFSAFMFHHLPSDEKLASLAEMHRVLRPGGELHLVDFTGREQAGERGLRRWLHAHSLLAENDRSTVLALLARAGFAAPRAMARRALWFAVVASYQASRADGRAERLEPA